MLPGGLPLTPGEAGVRDIRHFGIVVRDMERSLAFYRDLLGMTVRNRKEEKGTYLDTLLGVKNGEILTVKLSSGAGSSLLELIEFISPRDADPRRLEAYSVGPTHVALTVGDLGELPAALKKNGIRFLSEPMVSPDGKVRLVFCRDPDGNLVELVEELG
jgi:catechol 2,3-dioxygenase-like lactoylglutathione lyase family enzyme